VLVFEPLEKYAHDPFTTNITLTVPARLALNFKGICYETRWVEYPDLEQTLSPQFVPHTLNCTPC
jgi:hypothetical protein